MFLCGRRLPVSRSSKQPGHLLHHIRSMEPQAHSPHTSAQPEHLSKWQKYYDGTHQGGVLPWDSHAPASQLVHYMCSPNLDALLSDHQPASEEKDTVGTASWQQVSTEGGEVLVHSSSKGDPAPHTDELRPKLNGWCLELGCGTGSSSVFLAQQGMQVVGVDAVADAIHTARGLATQAGVQPTSVSTSSSTPGEANGCSSPHSSAGKGQAWFLQHDVFTLPRPFTPGSALQLARLSPSGVTTDDRKHHLPEGFDFIYDCQSFHVLRQVNEAAYLELLRTALIPGGYLMLLAGAVDEPAHAATGHPSQTAAATIVPDTTPCGTLAQPAGGPRFAATSGDSTTGVQMGPDAVPPVKPAQPVGPPQMTEAQLRAAFDEVDWEWVWLVKTRFDATEYYSKTFPKPPLAWWGLLRRRLQAVQ